MSSQQPGFSELLLGCLDRALYIVGTTGRDLVYEVLESRYEVQRDQIAEQPELLLKALRVSLGGSALAVEEELLARIKEASGVSADNLLDAIADLRQHFAAMAPPREREPNPASQGRWQLESQSTIPEVMGEGGRKSFTYSAKFSFGPAPEKRQEDPESREALEAYLRFIVNKHEREKRRELLE